MSTYTSLQPVLQHGRINCHMNVQMLTPYQLLYPNTLIFSTATFMTRHLDLVEWRLKHLSVLAQTIPDPDMCRFGGIDALDRWYVAHHSRQLSPVPVATRDA